MGARRILLADADAFYVSVARLVDPEGAGRARCLVVGGSAEGRGVVTSASYEARRFGVTSAMPMAQALRLCPEATVVPVPWDACVELSRSIRDIMSRFAPLVETASSDEYYLDLTGTEALYRHEPLADTARSIREAVLGETRLSVSIGGGTNRLVAKLAATFAKPGGVRVVEPGGEEEFLAGFALADIPLVGPRFQERLLRYNLRSVKEAVAVGREQLVGWLGREGEWLWERIHGRDSSPVEPRGDAKSISRDETFARDVAETAQLERKLIELVDRAASDLREDGLLARTITVRIRDADFTDRSAGRTLAEPVMSPQAVYRVARGLLRKLREAREVPARLLGVALSQLVREDAPAQLSLLEVPAGEKVVETERDRKVTNALDEVRRRLGFEALATGRVPRPRRRTSDRD
jgi:DNA polymerase-4